MTLENPRNATANCLQSLFVAVEVYVGAYTTVVEFNDSNDNLLVNNALFAPQQRNMHIHEAQ